MRTMGLSKYFLVALGFGLAFLFSCEKDKVEPQMQPLTAVEQLAIFLEDSGKVATAHTLSPTVTIYSEEVLQATGDPPAVIAENVVYFHYAIDQIVVTIDSVTADTSIIVTPYITMDLGQPSLFGQTGVDAIYPIGLDAGMLASGIQVGDHFNYYLPPEVAYGKVPMPGLPLNSIVRIQIQLDSIVSEQAMYNQATLDINQYIIDAELRDTSVVRGGPVVSLNDFLTFKSLDPDTTTRPRPILGDSVEINFKYIYPTDSLLDPKIINILRPNEYESPTSTFTFLVDDPLILPAYSEGIQYFRSGEHGMLIIHTQTAYHESICLVPGLRSGYWSRGDGENIQYLIENFVLPEYAFQVEPYQSLVMDITLRTIN